MTDTTNMTSDQIDLLKVEKEKELQKAQAQLHVVEIEELELAKKIVDLQSERKTLQIAISKGKQSVRTLTLDIRILVSQFWRTKNG